MLSGADAGRDASPRTDSKGADVVKSGHLKKQGGARGGRKNWKRRWFVLKPDYICYFQERDGKSADGPCLGVLPLRSAKVISVELIPEDGVVPSQSLATTASVPTLSSSPVTTCYMCHKPFAKKIVCKSCQNVFCENCASELQMGDKMHRVCSRCRCHITDEDLVKEKGSPLELGVIVEVQQREPKISNSMFFKKERPQHLFAIKTKERELWLAADDAQEKTAWINAIAEIILSFRKGATGSGDSGNSSKDEVPAPSGTLQWEIDYEAITILEKIGDGAFGEVFKGRLWGTDVAVKTIKPDQATEGVLEDLKKEVAILSQLRHPNIVLYIGACTKPPNVCIVTEWCDRGSLHDVLHDSNIPLDVQRIIDLAVGIAQGMNYLHSLERRIIHRDLKSHNIIVDRNFNVKVADFGLSHVRETLTQRNTDQNATQIIPRPKADFEMGDDETSVKITSESIGGHYGVFGTPEWMAPEIMEGTAYNQKVDVYSFGIMMSELLTRKLPFRDQYKIKSYLDVVDAVLDDGAMPTLPPWIGARLKRLIELCLSRNANARPSFTSIILKLRSVFSASPADLFIAFDIPRITHMLSSTDRHNQALAAKEISLFKFDHEFLEDGERRVCARCKYSAAQHRPLDDANITVFVSKLTDMLASSSAKVVLPAVEALQRLVMIGRHRSDTNLRTENLRIICEKNGVERLIGLVASKSERLSQMAARALMLLVDDLPVDDMSYRALKPTSLNVLSSLMTKEIVSLRESSHRLNESLQEKKETVSALSSSLAAISARKRSVPVTMAAAAGTAISANESMEPEQITVMMAAPEQSDTRLSLIDDTSVINKTVAELRLQPMSGTEVEQTRPNQMAAPQPVESADDQMAAPQPVESADGQMTAPQPVKPADDQRAAPQLVKPADDQRAAPQPVKSADAQMTAMQPVKSTADEMAAQQPVIGLAPVPIPSDTTAVSSSNANLTKQTSAESEPDDLSQTNTISQAAIIWPQTPSVTIPDILPAATLDRTTVFADFVLVHDSAIEAWRPKYVIVQPSLIIIYPSYESILSSPPSAPEFVVNTSVPPGKKLKFKTGRRYKQPYCFHLCCQGQKWWFALRSEKDTVVWSNILMSPLSKPIEVSIQQYMQLPNQTASTMSPSLVIRSIRRSQQSFDRRQDPVTAPLHQVTEPVASQIPIEIPSTPAPLFKTNGNNEESGKRESFPSLLEPAVVSKPEQQWKNVIEETDTSQKEMQLKAIQLELFPQAPSTSATESFNESDQAGQRPADDQQHADAERDPVERIPLRIQEPLDDPVFIPDSPNPDRSLPVDCHLPTELTLNEPLATPLALFKEDAEIPLTVRHRDDLHTDLLPSNSEEERAGDSSTGVTVSQFAPIAEENDAAEAAQHKGAADVADVLKDGAPESSGSEVLVTSNSNISIDVSESSEAEQILETGPVAEDHLHSDARLPEPLSESSSPVVNRFVQRYIEVAAPTNIDSEANVCITIKSGDELNRSDKRLNLKAMPPVPSLPAIFASEYGRRDCWQYDYLIIANIEIMKWEQRFVILLGTHPRRLMSFRNHESLDLIDEYILEGGARIADGHAVTDCLGFPVNVDPRLAFVVNVQSAKDGDQRDLLCICASEFQKTKWMSLIERIVLIARAT